MLCYHCIIAGGGFVIIVSFQGDALLSLYRFKVMLCYHCIIAGGCFVIIVSLQRDALLSLYRCRGMLCFDVLQWLKVHWLKVDIPTI